MRAILLVALVAAVLGCVGPSRCTGSTEPPTPAELAASTVKINVSMSGQRAVIDEKTGVSTTVPYTTGHMGSGVIYSKRADGHSLILTAHHVLDMPPVGQLALTEDGFIMVEAVKFEIVTNDGWTCDLKPLEVAKGDNSVQDVATAEASCDAGPTAIIAAQAPAPQDKVLVAGYPLDSEHVMITEGYVSGLEGGYLVTSAAGAPGNSGGPVFHDGKVVGILVRVGKDYSHSTLAIPLGTILERIAETK